MQRLTFIYIKETLDGLCKMITIAILNAQYLQWLV